MGISILWVMLFHTIGIFIVPYPLKAIQNTGYLGVDIFILLSSYGLCNSIKNNSLKDFFKRRIARIVPDFIFVTTLLFVSTNMTWESFLYEITFIGFFLPYLHHEVIYWYIPAILLLYAIFPFIYKKKEVILKYYCVISLLSFLIYSVVLLYLRSHCYPTYSTGLIARVPIFMLGVVLGGGKKRKEIV